MSIHPVKPEDMIKERTEDGLPRLHVCVKDFDAFTEFCEQLDVRIGKEVPIEEWDIDPSDITRNYEVVVDSREKGKELVMWVYENYTLEELVVNLYVDGSFEASST